jgi:hypothetical protein
MQLYHKTGPAFPSREGLMPLFFQMSDNGAAEVAARTFGHTMILFIESRVSSRDRAEKFDAQ